MPLVNCPECASEISSEAFKCPKCGKSLKTPKRSIFGKIMKWSFILFNVLMLIWLVTGMNRAVDNIGEINSVHDAGSAVGAGIGAVMLIVIWLLGDLFLGIFVVFTRPKN